MKTNRLARLGHRLLRKFRGDSNRFPWQWLTNTDPSYPFLTGNSIATHCRQILNYGPYRVNPAGRENWCFVKTDHLSRFFERHAPKDEFVLFTHNSDHEFTRENCGPYLDDPRVVAWFAINVACEHPKLFAIPIGLANAGYAHGDVQIVSKVQAEDHPKAQLFYINFTVGNSRPGVPQGASTACRKSAWTSRPTATADGTISPAGIGCVTRSRAICAGSPSRTSRFRLGGTASIATARGKPCTCDRFPL